MPAIVRTVECSCPAKINLSLSVMGQREDGFHELHSVVAQTEFGDQMRLSWDPRGGGSGEPGSRDRDTVTFSGKQAWMSSIDGGSDNTVSRALKVFRKASGIEWGSFSVEVEKRIPVGAGLGGGSSDAAALFNALRQIFNPDYPGIRWTELAAQIGSDCPLFLEKRAVVMEGRGERITLLEDSLAERIRDMPVILFKPGFSISTPEAYSRLKRSRQYSSREVVEKGMRMWQAGDALLPPMGNDFEVLCGSWIPSLAIVLEKLRSGKGLAARLSGSGSAGFIITERPEAASSILREVLEAAWGESWWMEVSKLK